MSFIDLRGRVSAVTGAGRGIGAATAEELARAGSDLALLEVNLPAAEELGRRLASEFGVRARGYQLDVRDAGAVEEAFTRIVETFGALDHLVNNAGIQHVAPLEEFPIERWEAVTATNLDGVFYCTRAVWPHMRQRERGRIVNIASVHGMIASEYKAAYIAAKHGVVGLTRAAALEGAPFGITVNAVAPGAVMTDLIRDQAQALAQTHGVPEEEALAHAFLSAMPSRRFIEPVEVAQLCVYLCTDAARSITGATVPIDGGWSAH